MLDVVRVAMKKMKYDKAAGPNDITLETLAALDDWGIDFITNLLNQIYGSGKILKEMCKSIFITLPKYLIASESTPNPHNDS